MEEESCRKIQTMLIEDHVSISIPSKERLHSLGKDDLFGNYLFSGAASVQYLKQKENKNAPGHM